MKTKRTAVFLLSLLVLLSCAGCGAKLTAHSIFNGKYSIGIPENWKKDMIGSVPYFSYEEDSASILIVPVVKTSAYTFDKFVESWKQSTFANSSGNTLDKAGAVKIGSLDGYFISYTTKSGKVFLYLVNAEDEYSLISCSVSAQNASKYEKIFAKAAKSFKAL